MRIILILILLLQISCVNGSGTSKDSSDQNNAETQKMDNINQEISSTDTLQINVSVPYEESIMLLGKIDRVGLSQEPFSKWFETGYNNFTPDAITITELKPLMNDITIKAFIGTWCEDSQRETPHLFKILEETNFDLDNLTLIAVSKEKDTPSGYEKGMEIEYVPTIIAYRNNEEIGRFVEYAVESLEKDLLAIVSGKDYKHSYE